MFGTLFLLWFFHGKIKREQVLHALVASLIAWVFAQGIKLLFPTLRPFEVGSGVPLTLTIPNDSAFPSTHTSMAFALANSIRKFHRKFGILYIFSALLVGFGRVLGNVHYYIDILGGAFVGVVSVYLLEKAHEKDIIKIN
ncbi:MAG: phosphatase PAP2 family protein [Candidatus Woesebacteria bacterium]|jgi:undecaprenyl-diphosphatase